MHSGELQNWIERLIRENAAIERVMDRQTEAIDAKDAEIARLTATLAGWEKAAEDCYVVPKEAGDPQPAQEQADEHPAKAGYIDTSPAVIQVPSAWRWVATAPIDGLDWKRAVFFWDLYQPEIIAAYERYMQEGGQTQ
jgi:hypothetical protein